MATADRLYNRLLSDPITRPFFADLDWAAIARKQVAFLSHAFGGPVEHRGASLREVHRPLLKNGLSDRHFDAVVEHLRASLEELHVAPDLVKEIVELVSGMRAEVLDR